MGSSSIASRSRPRRVLQGSKGACFCFEAAGSERVVQGHSNSSSVPGGLRAGRHTKALFRCWNWEEKLE
jgi:hypothetical protein